jgi:hypothetical protein
MYNNNIVEHIPPGSIGFVYIITNLTNNKKYIGKKLFLFSKTTYKVVKLKNGTKKKKKIRSKIDSDWQEYYGSSEALSKDVQEQGAENFKREILYYCSSKSECSYLEAREQFDRRVLESDEYYNGHVQVRVHKNHVFGKISNLTNTLLS